ncbi:MAG: TonB-dependent receptor, partial [Woeseiaceae bacterium]|nr:TonB-dependent receptor [Woeseiaceae bacterium]
NIDGSRLLRRAEQSATLTYTQNIGAHRLGLAMLASGEREDFGGVTLDSYLIANLSLQLQLSDTLQLNARIENLFDEHYQTAANFRMQEQSGFVELRYRWR